MENLLVLPFVNYLTYGLLCSLPILFIFGIYKLVKKDIKSVKRIVVAFTVIFLLISLIFTIIIKTPDSIDTIFLIPEDISGFDIFLGIIFPLTLLYFSLSIMYIIYKAFIKKEKYNRNIWILTVILFFIIMYTTYLYYISPPTFPQWHDMDIDIVKPSRY